MNNILNKNCCKDEAGFFVSSQWFCGHSYREGPFSGHAWKTVLKAIYVLVGLWLPRLPVLRTPEALNLRPAGDFSSQHPRGSRHELLAPVSPSSSPGMYAEHLCVSVLLLPQEKAQQRLRGRRMQRCPVRKRAAAWHLQVHTARGHPRRADWSPAPPAGTASVQSQLYPFPSSHGTSPAGNNLKTLKSQVAQESLS